MHKLATVTVELKLHYLPLGAKQLNFILNQPVITINFDFQDRGENHVLTIENGVLHHWKRPPADNANATVRLTHPALLALIGGQLSPQQLKVDGDRASLGRFFSLLEAPDRGFAIVTP